MSGHKFLIGDRVNFVPAFHQRSSTVIDFEIVRQLPDLNGEFFYRIKSSKEPHERVVGESQLRRPWLEEALPAAGPARGTKTKAKPKRKTT